MRLCRNPGSMCQEPPELSPLPDWLFPGENCSMIGIDYDEMKVSK